MSRGTTVDTKMVYFANVHRVTMLPVVSAAGNYSPTLFVFRGRVLPYSNVRRDRQIITETYADFLPRGSAVAVHDEVGGMDSSNIFNWAKLLADHVRDLTVNGRKSLLVYDGYRSHMSLRVLEYFKGNNIE
eukprot:IDg8804t1